MLRKLALLAACIAVLGSQSLAQTYKDPHAPVEARVQDLLKRMTLAEKLGQLRSDNKPSVYEGPLQTIGCGGLGIWTLRTLTPEQLATKLNEIQTMSLKNRLGIPIMPYEEALHGLIQNGHVSFPQAIAFAATWDPDFVHQCAEAIASETRSIGIRQVLSPVINVDRDARWGRMEETYGEDPYLTGKTAVAFVSAFEKAGVAATPKHFVANYGDGGRDSNSVHISERELRDIYLEPFRMAFEDGGASSVMVSYNAINGIPCASNHWLLTDVLRKEYGFQGFAISDWGAANNVYEMFHQARDYEHTAALELNAGMDCEDPTIFVFGKPLDDAVRDGLISMKTIDESVSRVLRIKFKLGLFDDRMVDPAKAAALANSQPHRDLAEEAARRSMVLLKNENATLPLSKNVKRIAVFGDIADGPTPLGGYSGELDNLPSLLDGLKQKQPETQFDFVPGCTISPDGALPAIPTEALQTPDGQPGLKAEYFTNIDLKGEPAFTRVDPSVSFDWGQKAPKEGFPLENYSTRWTGFLTAPKTSTYTIAATSDDGMRVWINDKLIADQWSTHSAQTVLAHINLVAGQRVPIKVEYFQGTGDAIAKVGWVDEQAGNGFINQVSSAANAADCSIVFAGIREGEGQDRAYLGLPGNQVDVIKAAAASGKPVVVVLVAGAPVTMEGWVDQVPAILDAWYPGEEGPKALADTLFGDSNPGGKLPVTFPRTVGQCPLYYNYEPTGRGYGYVDSSGDPLFPFGHGLSYTTFEYSNLKISGSYPYQVSVDVSNTGQKAGDEVVQLYIHQEVSSVIRPIKELKGFERIALQPGEKKTVSFPVGFAQLSMWDAQMHRVVEAETFDIMIGSSSADIRQKGTVTVSRLIKDH
ncbi:MAG TPA: glycoside hydrolase family 3 N-terminal domain-containing protein [Fimbriimonadaceae bacterium]|jgi:beta-glucosidase